MKFRNILLLNLIFVSLLILPNEINAQDKIELNILRSEYSPRETVQIEIKLNEFPLGGLNSDDLKVLKDNQKISTGFILLNTTNKDYFAYFDLPSSLSLGEYFFMISTKYKVGSSLQEFSKQAKFSVNTSLNTQIISIKPAILKLDKSDSSFKLQIKNHGSSTTVNLEENIAFLEPARDTLDLRTGDLKSFSFRVIGKKPEGVSKHELVIGKYSIPVWYYSEDFEAPPNNQTQNNQTNNGFNQSQQYNQSNQTFTNQTIPKNPLRFIAKVNYLNKTVKEYITLNGTINYTNLLSEPLYNLVFELTGNLNEIVRLNETRVNILNPLEIKGLYLWVNEDKNPQKEYYFGSLKISSREFSDEFKMYFSFILTNKTQETQQPPGKKEEKLFPPSDEKPPSDYLLNKTKPKPDEEEEIKIRGVLWVVVVIAILILIMLFIIIKLKGKKVVKKTFDDYVRGLGNK